MTTTNSTALDRPQSLSSPSAAAPTTPPLTLYSLRGPGNSNLISYPLLPLSTRTKTSATIHMMVLMSVVQWIETTMSPTLETRTTWNY